jgi:L-rhamnose mutarotase
MQRFVQTLELADSPESIQEYRRIHDEIWPEITRGIRSVGINRMDIYLHGNRAVMIVDMPDDIDFDTAMTQLATLPRQQEWENFVGRYQKCEPGSTSAGKWKRMTQIFELPE